MEHLLVLLDSRWSYDCSLSLLSCRRLAAAAVDYLILLDVAQHVLAYIGYKIEKTIERKE